MPTAQQDLLHVLAREHREHSGVFHDLVDHVGETAPRHRRRQFGTLVLHLGVHLTAETLLVHPLLVAASVTGEDTRRAREREILSVFGRLTAAGSALDDPKRLGEALRVASGDVAAHADREELEVFVHVRRVATPKRLRQLGRLHSTLRQRLPSRYQREGRAPTEPWNDEHLPQMLRSWYEEALPAGSDPGSAVEGGGPSWSATTDRSSVGAMPDPGSERPG